MTPGQSILCSMETPDYRIVYALQFMRAEDLLTDERFLGWYHKTSDEAVRFYDAQIEKDPAFRETVKEAARLLTQIQIKEKGLSNQAIEDAAERLMKNILNKKA